MPDSIDSPEEPIAELHPSDALALDGHQYGKHFRFVLSVLGVVPWIGGVIAAAGAFSGELAQDRVNSLFKLWLDEHEKKLRELKTAINEVANRIDEFGPKAAARAESEEFLGLARHGFRAWDSAPTSEKRRLIQTLLSHAATSSLTSDDVVRLFIDWIARYHEIHFRVIARIHHKPGSTRREIWHSIGGPVPRDDSAEADLFKLLIRDLSTGSVIRQERETDGTGSFRKRASRASPTPTMTSAFDDSEGYVLTALGRQFVHYAMTDLVPRVGRG